MSPKTIEIQEHTAEALDAYASVPIGFRVSSLLRVEWADGGLGGIQLTEEPVQPSYFKNYDQWEPPLEWRRQWDISRWGLFLVSDGTQAVGGAMVAWQTPSLHLLEGRDDLALLWDIRVHPQRRREGIGQKLFQQAVAWAKQRRCRTIKVETQNTNVPACRFYAAQGCRLGGVRSGVYAEFPEEIMLLWYLDLQ